VNIIVHPVHTCALPSLLYRRCRFQLCRPIWFFVGLNHIHADSPSRQAAHSGLFRLVLVCCGPLFAGKRGWCSGAPWP